MNKDLHQEDQRKLNAADMITEKVWKEEFPYEMQRTLRMIGQHDLVGALMKKAMEQGEFDNLEGSGQPLDLAENPFEASDLHMVNKILKNAGYAPYWIELNKEINALRAQLEQEVAYFKKYSQVILSEKRSDWSMRRYEQKKQDFYLQTRERLEEISKKILDYNLHCPVSILGKFNFDIAEEMSRIAEEIEDVHI